MGEPVIRKAFPEGIELLDLFLFVFVIVSPDRACLCLNAFTEEIHRINIYKPCVMQVFHSK